MVSAIEELNRTLKDSICLNPYYTGRWFLLLGREIRLQRDFSVLILIILEDGFCLIKVRDLIELMKCLNPYYTGRWFLLL